MFPSTGVSELYTFRWIENS